MLSGAAVSGETVTPLERFPAPWNKEVTLQAVLHDSGLRMLRIRIKEGTRFTVMDVDEDTARRWGRAMVDWAGDGAAG
ncbi:MAG: hypothetical protein JSU82_17470 [Rhodospirillales bacterium]|nr:MAG: hypothetical protein JSU82_17470 [Rhodospirillales bacterium]